jgi:hypothetical protein
VYDALNVLISLGVLRKSGNKIMSKKDQRALKSEGMAEAENKKEQFEEELEYLKEAYNNKLKILKQKEQLVK